MKKGLIRTIVVSLTIITLFYGLEGCFWLLNQASSLANVLGILGTGVLVTFSFYKGKEIVEKIKED
jgi:hypothetical protein